MAVRAIRGAITVEENTAECILEAAKTLLTEISQRNHLNQEDIISVFFSTTKDLNAIFPAVAARQMGWTDTPLFCSNEMDVPGSLAKCLRVLIHVNTDIPKNKIAHIYLKGAQVLRPDLTGDLAQNGQEV